MSSKKIVGYVSDIEGNYDYWRKYISRSEVLHVTDNNHIRLRDQCHFVCGGDVCDRGAGDIRVLKELLSLKTEYPDRVHFVLGNRDINKLRLPATLHPSVLRQRPDVYWFNSAAQEVGKDFQLDNAPDRMKWTLKNTMGSPFSFECRRQELKELNLPSDDQSVVDSYLTLIMPGGDLFEYIRLGCMAVIIEDALFVHGGLPDDFIGYVPPGKGKISQYYTEVHEWVRAINAFAHEELEDFKLHIHDYLASLTASENAALQIWDSESGYAHPQPGSRLIQCGMGTSGKDNGKNPTVIYTSYLQGGSPVWPSDRATEWLGRGGVTKLIVGHQPMGDTPLIISSPGGLNIFCADVCYSKGVQYRSSDLRRSIQLPNPPLSESASRASLADSKESPPEEDKWVSYHSYATEQGILPVATKDPWVVADTRATHCIAEVSLVSEDDEPLQVCVSDHVDFTSTPKVTTALVKGVLSQGGEYQFTFPEDASNALIGKKTSDNWIIKARGIHLSAVDGVEYVQMGISQGIEFKAKLLPISEVQQIDLMSSWEIPVASRK